MPDKYDPYREALVMETRTVWPAGFDDLDDAAKNRVAQRLHENPANATHLEYLRVHTGFCRQITVTEDDIQRIGV